MRESYFQGQLCGQNAVKDFEKKFWKTLRGCTFSNHTTETNSAADKYFGHFQSSELNICLYIFFRVPTILVLPWILSKAC